MQRIQWIGGVGDTVGNLRPERRAVRVGREQVDVRLDERQVEERGAGPLGCLVVVGPRIERAERKVELVGDDLIQVNPEVAPVVPIKPGQHPFLPGVLERGIPVRVLPALTYREVVRQKLAAAKRLILVVAVHQVRIVGDAIGLGHAGAVGRIGRAASRSCVVAARIDFKGMGAGHRNTLGQIRPPVLVPEREVQLALGEVCASLGEDLHDAVRGIGAVQG